MDVKRRVRAARRDQKRDSKVGLSDEIIFFDDVAGNARAKVGPQGWARYRDGVSRSHRQGSMSAEEDCCRQLLVPWRVYFGIYKQSKSCIADKSREVTAVCAGPARWPESGSA